MKNILKALSRGSLQGRLLVWVTAAVVAVWATVTITAWIDARHELSELLDAHLAQSAALLVHREGVEIEDHEREFPEARWRHRYGQRVAFQIWSRRRLLLKSSTAPDTPLSERSEGFATRSIDGVGWRVFAASGEHSETRILIGERVDARDEVLWAITHNLLWPLAVALPLLGILIIFAVRTALRPLTDLSRRVAAREPASLESLPTAGIPSEVQPLVQEINALFERVQTVLENERRFTADAAHELRTPVAAVRAQAQAAMGATDDTERKQSLEATLKGCDRAAHLIEQLLTLARFESSASVSPEAVDLDELTRAIIAELAPHAVAKQQQIEMHSAGSCHIETQPAMIAILLRNLIDNAVRYSPAGASIRVTLKNDGAPSIKIEDSGPGLSADQQSKLGERFFRVLGSGETGCGLGWSIVRRIAQAHNLPITTERSSEFGGFQVTVRWPRKAANAC